MTVYANGKARSAIIDGLGALVYQDQRNYELFSINSKQSITVSRIYTHKSGRTLEDFHLCDEAFQKPLVIALLDPNIKAHRSSSEPKRFYIHRIFRGLDDSSLAVDGVALGSYLDSKAIYNIPRYDVTTCTISKLKDLKFLKLWIEYHRVILWSPKIYLYVLVEHKNFFDPYDRWKSSVTPISALNLEWASQQDDVEIIEWPLLSKDLGVESSQHVCLQRNHVREQTYIPYNDLSISYPVSSYPILHIMISHTPYHHIPYSVS